MGWGLLCWLWKKDEHPRTIPLAEVERETLQKRFEQYKLENKLLLDYRYSKKVEQDLQEHPLFENKDNPTPEELEENQKLWEKIEKSEFMKFVAKSNEVAEQDLQREFEINKFPYRREDDKLWQSLPYGYSSNLISCGLPQSIHFHIWLTKLGYRVLLDKKVELDG